MKSGYKYIFYAGAYVAVLFASAGASAESLQDAVISALNQHPSVKAAQAGHDSLTQDIREQRAGYFPKVSLQGTGGRLYADNSTSRGLSVTRGAGYSWLWEGSATLTQPVFNGFATSNRIDSARARAEAADINILDVRDNLALRTALTYLEVLRARDTVDKMRIHTRKIDDFVDRIQKMVSEGAADATLTEQARDIRAQLLSALADAQGSLESARISYVELTGHEPDDNMQRPLLRIDTIPPTAEEAMAVVMSDHPLIKASQLSEQASREDADAEKGAYYPSVNGELSYLKRDQRDLIGGESTDKRAIVRVSWDYAVGGATQARIKREMFKAAESHAQMQQSKRQIERDIGAAYVNRLTAQEQFGINQQRVEINEGLLKTQNAQFEAAKVNLLQLLQTENALFNARMALLNSDYRLQGSQYAILGTMGKLQEALDIVPVAARDEKPH